MKYKAYDHQVEASLKMLKVLEKYNLCYVHGEVRTGKTVATFETCEMSGCNNILFITKKKAISSIESDHTNFGYDFDLTVINYESVHKVEGKFDLVVYDESHCFGSFPKPSNQAKFLKQKYGHLPCIFLTGTPAVESGSQWFHQFWVSNSSPFKKYKNFYQWSKHYVAVYKVNYGNGYPSNKYDKANRELIQKEIDPYIVTFTQQDAGIDTQINENIYWFDNKPITDKIVKKLLNDRMVKGKNDEILAETPVKLMAKLHQIYNGSCIAESGETLLLDDSKSKFINMVFEKNKIAILYYFKGELELLKQVYGENLTTDLDEFNTTDKNIALQQTGTEGMNLSKAEYLVYYNFGFSGTKYIQSRDRLTTKNRASNSVIFIFAKGGINEKIYKKIKNKRNFNIKQFNKEYSYGETNG